MATGQSISVLARAYSYGREEKYYDAALKAIAWYKLRQRESGFQAVFMEKYIWFEEYPTDPPTFVLNGFMYSLMG